jgi:hypothetical protein
MEPQEKQIMAHVLLELSHFHLSESNRGSGFSFASSGKTDPSLLSEKTLIGMKVVIRTVRTNLIF